MWSCHQEVAFTSLPLKSRFGHVAFFGQCDIRKCERSRGLKSACTLGLAPIWCWESWDHPVKKPLLACCQNHVEKKWGDFDWQPVNHQSRAQANSDHPGPAQPPVDWALWASPGNTRERVTQMSLNHTADSTTKIELIYDNCLSKIANW